MNTESDDADSKQQTPSWELWRQDDNGNRFLVGIFGDKSAAETKLTELSSGEHKQIYWISSEGESANRQV